MNPHGKTQQYTSRMENWTNVTDFCMRKKNGGGNRTKNYEKLLIKTLSKDNSIQKQQPLMVIYIAFILTVMSSHMSYSRKWD